tara:strand:+ start:518 stop:946 length:429 start_codon:yes stop_codon:yes gene_type:complete
MKIKLLTLGKIKEKVYKYKINEYIKWIRKDLKLDFITLKDKKTKDLNNSLKAYYSSSIFCSLSEDGEKMDSNEFSDFIFKTNKTLVFFISGPDGCPEVVKKNSGHIVSLSDFTFPHEMATLILIEQVYRAISIHKNSRYHRK